MPTQIMQEIYELLPMCPLGAQAEKVLENVEYITSQDPPNPYALGLIIGSSLS